MASVLDAFRGKDRKDKDFLIAAVPDEVYQSWVDELESVSPKQRKNGRPKLRGVTVARKQFDLKKKETALCILSQPTYRLCIGFSV